MSIKTKFIPILALSLAFLCPAKPASAAPPAFTSVRANMDSVPLYEKFELGISLQAAFTNPFDPAELDLEAAFTSPTGQTWTIPGFYNPSGWNRSWMVRFSPTETGEWRYLLKVTDTEGTARSEPGRFTVTGSSHHGGLKIAPNGRYLRYADGSSFYGVGMWYNDSYEEFNGGQITEEGLDNLKRHGANFIAFFPTPLETLATGLGRYDQNRCGRLDQLFDWCEKRDLHISWNVWFHSYISETVWGGGNARYLETPYSRLCKAVDFFSDPAAWEYQRKLFRYMIARWGYSRSLFLWFVVDEIDGTEGWVYGDTAVAEAWAKKIHDYFKENDPYGRPTTGTRCGAFKAYWPGGYGIFDIAAREIYEAQGFPMPEKGKITPKDESPLRYSYRNYAGEIRKLWNTFSKPVMIGETGWDHTYYEPGMPGYLALYHNVLWVSLSSGAASTPFWWAYSDWINDGVVTSQMTNFAKFVADIDFAALELKPTEISAGECDAYAMMSDKLIFGWVVNPREGVANEKFTLNGLPRDGDCEVRLYRTWRGQYLDPQTVTCRGSSLTVNIPELRTEKGHANNIGNDIAFKIYYK